MNDADFMKLAIEEAKKCKSVQSAFNVGAILVTNDKIVAGYSRELEGNTHAEQCCLLKVNGEVGSLPHSTSVLYTTMEPCGERLSGKMCCAQLIITGGIKRVVYGCKEPGNFINTTKGLKLLIDAGIEVVHLEELESECQLLNRHFK